MKRWRSPKAKDGELKAQWGKIDRHNNPDLCYAWGKGIGKCDAHLLHNVLSSKRCATNWDAPLGSPRILWTKYEPSFLEELEDRGYDLTTLKVIVQKMDKNKYFSTPQKHG